MRQSSSGLLVPDGPQILRLHAGHMTEYGRKFFEQHIDFERLNWECDRLRQRLSDMPPIAGASGTFSNYTETHVLEHVAGKTSWTMPAVVNLALCTVVPDSSKTGATITEATYTGYAKLSLASAFSAAVSGGAGAASSITNSGTLTFAACTAGSSTIIGWAMTDSATAAAGNALAWGSATSTVISTTQTPPTVAASGLSLTLT